MKKLLLCALMLAVAVMFYGCSDTGTKKKPSSKVTAICSLGLVPEFSVDDIEHTAPPDLIRLGDGFGVRTRGPCAQRSRRCCRTREGRETARLWHLRNFRGCS